jgi:hypothetical protein
MLFQGDYAIQYNHHAKWKRNEISKFYNFAQIIGVIHSNE